MLCPETLSAFLGLLDVELRTLFFFTFLIWLLLPRWPSLRCCFFPFLFFFFNSQLQLINLLMIFSFTPQHDGSLLESVRASFSNTPTAFGSSVREEPVFVLPFPWFLHCFSCSVFSVFN